MQFEQGPLRKETAPPVAEMDARLQRALVLLKFPNEDNRKAAMLKWIEGNNQSLAARYRAYVSVHGVESIDLNNEAQLRSVLAEIERTDESLH